MPAKGRRSASLNQTRVEVRAVILVDGRLAIHHERQVDGVHRSLPGGRVKHGEGILEALVREVSEEMGLLVDPDRLLYVAEVRSGRGVHDLNLVFLAHLQETSTRTAGLELLDLDDPAVVSVRPPCIDRIRQGVENDWSGTPEWLGNVWDEHLGVS
jgi:ADP-ribose pyrophosphatase YjhB (NUDIX family)